MQPLKKKTGHNLEELVCTVLWSVLFLFYLPDSGRKMLFVADAVKVLKHKHVEWGVDNNG